MNAKVTTSRGSYVGLMFKREEDMLMDILSLNKTITPFKNNSYYGPILDITIEDMKDWCIENCEHRFAISYLVARFEDSNDHFAWKLVWGPKLGIFG